MFDHEKYMRRALQLAAKSPYHTHSNPMVGAVIVGPDGKIIGEGYHRRCGEGHAEVNAVASVNDPELLKDSTMYVTLEPCSHYGKTPPCAQLIIDKGIPRVVVGAVDPFEKVAGRGIRMLREADVEVTIGVLADESRALNERFFTAHTLGRPFVTIKWAASADGFMNSRSALAGGKSYRFSNHATTMLTHRQRAMHDAILTTAATYLADHPSLTTREYDGPSPRRFIVDRSCAITPGPEGFEILNFNDIASTLAYLYKQGVTSLLIEAGPRYLQAVIDSGLWDKARVEISADLLGSEGIAPAPSLPSSAILVDDRKIGHNRLMIYSNPVEKPDKSALS